jgi:replicative DNA helicase
MDVLDVLDSCPPADIEAEQLLLSAALVANPQERNQLLRSVATADFHDPFHAWVFRLMRAAPHLEYQELVAVLLQERRPRAAEDLGRMLIRNDGESRCGLVAHWRRYRDRILRAAKLRKELTDGITRAVAAAAEWQATSLLHAGTSQS